MPKKMLSEAIAAFEKQHEQKAPETRRKYRTVLRYLAEYCGRTGIEYLVDATLERLDGHVTERYRLNMTWLKEIEVLRQFFAFCVKRKWCEDNPAADIARPKLREQNSVIPYTPDEVAKIIAACDKMGRSLYERLRTRTMVLLMRFAGLRISDVVTLSREHIQGNYLVKRAVKNNRLIRVELPGFVLQALAITPHPKAAPKDSKMYFAGPGSSRRSLLSGAERSMRSVFKLSGVEGAHCHRFRHTLASELLGKGEAIDIVAEILADSPAIIRRHYAKWTPGLQSLKDAATRKIHDTNLAQAEESVIVC
jgi:site-specific recombinase XerD